MKVNKDEHGAVIIYPFYPDSYTEYILIYPDGLISLSKGDWRHLSAEDARRLAAALTEAARLAESKA